MFGHPGLSLNSVHLLLYIHSCSILPALTLVHFQKKWNQCKQPENWLKLLDINSGVHIHGSTSSTDPAGPLLSATCQNSIPDQQPLTRLLPVSFLNGSDWNTHSPDYHASESPLLWIRQEHDGLAGPYPSAPFPSSPDSFCFILLLPQLSLTNQIFIFNHDLKLFLTR